MSGGVGVSVAAAIHRYSPPPPPVAVAAAAREGEERAAYHWPNASPILVELMVVAAHSYTYQFKNMCIIHRSCFSVTLRSDLGV